MSIFSFIIFINSIDTNLSLIDSEKYYYNFNSKVQVAVVNRDHFTALKISI